VRTRRGCATFLSVPSATTHLELAIDVDSDPISGLVSEGTQARRRFSGWIELVAAIEAARRSGIENGATQATRVQTLGSLPGAKLRACV
jgi:hypothetical protein